MISIYSAVAVIDNMVAKAVSFHQSHLADVSTNKHRIEAGVLVPHQTSWRGVYAFMSFVFLV